MADLFADSDDSTEDITLKTENEYAKRYDAWREKEELHKLEQKYGENPTEEDLESSESEDDDEPPEVSEKLEKDFLKTLSLLKTKDPRIYDPGFKFFAEGEKSENKEETNEASTAEKPQKAVSSLAAAFGASDDEDDGEIFKVEQQTEQPKEKEDKLKEFLTGKAEHLGDESEEDLQALKALWSDPKLNEGEVFLRDYILNKRYLAEDEDGPSGKLLDDAELEADAAAIEEQGKFERAYNFRFEEPDQEYLKRYPRTIGGTRPKDDRRAKKRAEIRERKEHEKRKKMEEIGRLKALKLKEIQEKIEQIKHVTGNKELAFQEEDIEGEFDPAEHDRRMAAIFNEEYYGECDNEKPVFPDLDEELEIENWEKFEEEMGNDGPSTSTEGPHCEDEDFNMDAEYDPKKNRATLLEEIQETLGKKRRNRKRKSKLAQVLATQKPKYDPVSAKKTYDEYMEEYYKMDCEDVIGGDLPTRFKYREVVPNSYGLSVEEILLADDKELNKWASLKKTVKYRPEHVEKGEVKTYQLKASDVSIKKKLLPSLFKEIEDPEPAVVESSTVKKKKKKKKKNKVSISIEQTEEDMHEPSTSATTAVVTVEVDEKTTGLTEDSNIKSEKKKKKKKTANKTSVEVNNIDDIPTKKKMYKIFTNEDVSIENSDSKINNGVTEAVKKKKRKNKKSMENSAQTIENIPSKDKNKKLKRKFADEGPSHGKKMKFNHKNKSDKDSKSGLSDERLKAYGLNPKKYRNFLKHKKF